MNGTNTGRWGAALLLVASMALLSGCASTASRESGDPLEPANRVAYDFNDTLDRWILVPVAETYHDITPAPVRAGVTNFFSNVAYLNVIFNDLLQGKFLQAIKDSGRFIANSTLGIGGLFDVATQMGLPENDEDLGQTFGVWGAGEGAYLTLPFLGPNSVRDAPDLVTSTLLSPLFYVASVYLIPVAALNVINTRANLLEATRVRDEAALDPYVFTREAYRQQREYLIHDGNPPQPGVDDMWDDEDVEDPTSISTAPVGEPAAGSGGAADEGVLKIE